MDVTDERDLATFEFKVSFGRNVSYPLSVILVWFEANYLEMELNVPKAWYLA